MNIIAGKLNWLALTFGDANCASTQYRLVQYLPQLNERGIHLDLIPGSEFTDWKSIPAYHGVLIQKKLFNPSRISQIRKQTRHLLYDIDDAIWHPHAKKHHFLTRWRTHRRLKAIARAADLCVPANEYLARQLRAWGGKAEVIPMGLDDSKWTARAPHGDPVIRLGWSGAPGNLPYLEALEPALAEVQRKHPQIELTVLCGTAPKFRTGLSFRHVTWQPGIEPEIVRSFDIGLLPLPESDFARGKSPIKALQYMASGLMTVANPLDATTELFEANRGVRFVHSLEEWRDTLLALVEDPARIASEGALARTRFEQCFRTSHLGDRVAQTLLRGRTTTTY